MYFAGAEVPLFAPPSPHRPDSLDSKNPKTEKSPCVIVAFAAEVHSVATPAHAAINKFRHRTPRPSPHSLFIMCPLCVTWIPTDCLDISGLVLTPLIPPSSELWPIQFLFS